MAPTRSWPSSASRTSKTRKLENPVVVPGVLSFLCYGSFGSTVKGLNDFPESEWPHNVELLYYAYHIMVGLGTIFTLVMAVAAFLLWRGKLHQCAQDALGADALRALSRTSPRPPAGGRRNWADNPG